MKRASSYWTIGTVKAGIAILTALSKEIASRVTEIDQHRSPNNADSNSAATL